METSKIFIAILALTIINSVGFADLPDYFDWRNVNGEDWMSPVRFQGDCGSCWAFAAVGTVEAQYNIILDWPDYDIDLSEENLVSNCYSQKDCRGGWHYLAFDFIKTTGITDEACFPYVDQDCPMACGCEHGCSNAECSDRCAEWADRLWKIDDKQWLLGDPTNEIYKYWIYNVGPLAAALDIGHAQPDQYGVYTCVASFPPDHVVIITGWGYDAGGEYWIAKNSWGMGWNPSEGGYFRIRINKCGITGTLYGVILTEPSDTDKFIVKNASGKTVAWFGDLGNIVLKGALEENSDFDPSTGHNEFVFQNANEETLAVIDTTNGNMYIEGEAHPNLNMLYPEGFIVISLYGGSYIDDSGDLYLSGQLYQNPTP